MSEHLRTSVSLQMDAPPWEYQDEFKARVRLFGGPWMGASGSSDGSEFVIDSYKYAANKGAKKEDLLRWAQVIYALETAALARRDLEWATNKSLAAEMKVCRDSIDQAARLKARMEQIEAPTAAALKAAGIELGPRSAFETLPDDFEVG
jgi:hypothetical protein